MFALILTGLKSFGGWIVGGLAIVGSIFVIAEEEKSKGALEQQTADSDATATRVVNETTAATQTEVKAVENENDSEKTVASLPVGGAAAELLANWQAPSAAVDSPSGAAKTSSD